MNTDICGGCAQIMKLDLLVKFWLMEIGFYCLKIQRHIGFNYFRKTKSENLHHGKTHF